METLFILIQAILAWYAFQALKYGFTWVAKNFFAEQTTRRAFLSAWINILLLLILFACLHKSVSLIIAFSIAAHAYYNTNKRDTQELTFFKKMNIEILCMILVFGLLVPSLASCLLCLLYYVIDVWLGLEIKSVQPEKIRGELHPPDSFYHALALGVPIIWIVVYAFNPPHFMLSFGSLFYYIILNQCIRGCSLEIFNSFIENEILRFLLLIPFMLGFWSLSAVILNTPLLQITLGLSMIQTLIEQASFKPHEQNAFFLSTYFFINFFSRFMIFLNPAYLHLALPAQIVSSLVFDGMNLYKIFSPKKETMPQRTTPNTTTTIYTPPPLPQNALVPMIQTDHSFSRFQHSVVRNTRTQPENYFQKQKGFFVLIFVFFKSTISIFKLAISIDYLCSALDIQAPKRKNFENNIKPCVVATNPTINGERAQAREVVCRV